MKMLGPGAVLAITTIAASLWTTDFIAVGSAAEAVQSMSGKTIYTPRGKATYHANGEYTWSPKRGGTYKGRWRQTGSTVCVTNESGNNRCTTFDFRTQTGRNSYGSFRFWY